MGTLIRRKEKLQSLERATRSRLKATQNFRLVIAGVFFLILTIAAAKPGSGLEAPSILLFTVVFSFLVWRTRKLKRFAFRLNTLSDFYERHARRQAGLAVNKPWAAAQNAAVVQTHQTTTNDLGLIGGHSLFTLLDETVSDGGRAELLTWMLAPKFTAGELRERQSLVRDLRSSRWLFIRLLIDAKETELELSTHQALEFLKRSLLAESAKKWVLAIVVLWSVCLVGAVSLLTLGNGQASFFITAYIVASFIAFQNIGPVFMRGVGLANHLGALMKLFRRLEAAPKSAALQKLLPQTLSVKPSTGLRRFNFVLAFLSAEAHPLIYILLNAVFPWAPVFSWLLERERRKISSSFPQCMDEFHRLEAFASICFLHIYQAKTFPSISESPQLEFKGLYHPLIPRDKVVANDFAFPVGKTLGLITGSNMSGKSTFLRTIGINQTLANMGAPVFAESFTTSAFKLGTCIQVSDSLRDGFSYFYSEVLRLQRLIEEVKSGIPVLFLIDEIFRGTNNRERQIGSRAVIRALQSPTSVGFVSTHDLELTSLEDTLPAVRNLHFKEEIRDGEMWFSYRLQNGPCPTTNALKIMERAGLDLSFEI